ncbi:MAG: ABC transporter permease [Proteocatella sp.]
MKIKKCISDIIILTNRSIGASLRMPYVYIPNFIISIFFLFVYSAGLGSVTKLVEMQNINYISFILPISIVSSAIGAASGAVSSLVKDLECGYFERLMLTPVSRVAIVLGPILNGMFHLTAQSIILLILSMFLGVKISVVSDFLLIFILVMGLGLAFTGYAVTVALITKNSFAVQMSTTIFFPMIFLSTTFVPLNLIEAKWLRIAAVLNPTTYIFESMRGLLIDGWNESFIVYGFQTVFFASVITIFVAVISASKTFNRD